MSLFRPTKLGCFISSRSEAVIKLDHGPESVKKSDTSISIYDNGSKERIKNMLKKADYLSVSSYDTAWMAMVPSSSVNPHLQAATPQFPSCLNWVLNNQLSDGSWGLCDRDATLTMDALSSTLACVLALKQWGTGERQINMGLEFIAKNSAFANDEKQRKPIGFDIIFPGMIDQAKSMNLNVPIRQSDFDALLQRRNLELESSTVDFLEGRRAYLSYVSEGVGIYQDWEMAIKYQRKNGSLLNSPSATAAAFSQLHNADCLRYLNLLLDRFGDAVPAVYPKGAYTRLWMVDNLERLGIHYHFKEEIENVLEETYRLWLQGEEEIFQDTATCVIAFRLLRLHGYDVSSDALRHYADEDCFRNTLEGYLGDTGLVLELYKASEIAIYQDEVILEKIKSWTSHFLTECLQHTGNNGLLDKHLYKEVDNALRFPYHADMEWLATGRNIENYKYLDNTRILKSAVRNDAIGNKDFLNLAVEDFNKNQLIYQKELKDFQRWIVEKRLDKLKYARLEQLPICYFSAAASVTNPELSDVRMTWAKHSVMIVVVDDFFDYGGSKEELEMFIEKLEDSMVRLSNSRCFRPEVEDDDNIIGSEKVEILYSALDSLICETSDKAFGRQGRCVRYHATEMWLNLSKCFLKEAEWSREKLVPTMSEYMANAYITIGSGPSLVLPVYCVGTQLSQAAIQSPQFQNLYELVAISTRLLNDVQTFKRESEQGKFNAVIVEMMQSGSDEEEAINTIKGVIRSKTRELLRCVLLVEEEEEEGSCSVIPRECKDMFWRMNTTFHLVYLGEDTFTTGKLMNDIKTLFQQPISTVITTTTADKH